MIDRAGEPALKRGLGLVLLTLYGVGVTVGAGIYVLTGAVAGEAASTDAIRASRCTASHGADRRATTSCNTAHQDHGER